MKEKMDKNLDKDMLAIMNGVDKLVGKQNRVGYEKLKNFCEYEILDKQKDYLILLIDCQKPNTLAETLFYISVYKYCPYCGKETRRKKLPNNPALTSTTTSI